MIIGDNPAQGRCCIYLVIIIAVFINNSRINCSETSTPVIGQNVSIQCNLQSRNIWWTKNHKNITAANKRYIPKVNKTQLDVEDNMLGESIIARNFNTYMLEIIDIHKEDVGNYSCHSDEIHENYTVLLQPVHPAQIIDNSPKRVEIHVSKYNEVFCLVKAYPTLLYRDYIKWFRGGNDKDLGNHTIYNILNETHINVTLSIEDASKKDNGTYYCSIVKLPSVEHENRIESSVFVMDKPQVSIDYIKAVGADKIFMNLTVMDGNSAIVNYFLQYLKEGTSEFKFYAYQINPNETKFVLEKFEPNTKYSFKIQAKNKLGEGPTYTYPLLVKTLEDDPIFIPEIKVTGNTHSSVTIGWAPPPVNILEYIQYYELIVTDANNASIYKESVHQQNSRNLPYMFGDLKTSTEYIFKVRACSELTKLCGNWSEKVRGTTSDGISSQPKELIVNCDHFNISRRNSVSVTWDPPISPNGMITKYQVDLRGQANFKNDKGLYQIDDMGVKSKHVEPGKEKRQKAVFESVAPNTNYTVTVSAITRSKKLGEHASATCTMPPTVPENIGKLLWGKLKTEKNDWIFKLYLRRLSERNGPICCYRVYLVRVPEQNQQLDLPETLDIQTYHEVHAWNNTKGGAYIAEVLSSLHLQTEVFLGDGESTEKNRSVLQYDKSCHACLTGVTSNTLWRRKYKTSTTTQNPVFANNIDSIPSEYGDLPPELPVDSFPINFPPTEIPSPLPSGEKFKRKRRRRRLVRDISENSIMLEDSKTPNPTGAIKIDGGNAFEIFDGPLDSASYYTGFVEVIVKNDNSNGNSGAGNNGDILSTFSDYFQVMSAGAPPVAEDVEEDISAMLNIIVQILCVLILLVLVLLMALCFLHRYYSKHAGQGDEVISLRDSLSRALCGGRSSHNHHRHLIGSSSSKPPDVAPIPREDLPQAYVNRHKDSDYGFQHEFEMLPDRFSDRTTKYSDSKENVYKNRYPDIKSYDQTRVKLSIQNSTPGSDYINANFVLGYKERKKFICAQGPMESTVIDFWRMIWEQHLEIIVMLTNLEEYNKSKCAKYWPEKIGEATQIGDILVTFNNETRYSDYLVRDLRLVKRNENSDDAEERRTITQYHYLVWKDFMAPEHPHGIIKFIRQINSVYSVQRGPILIHCSAGVGRTGTLVALDSLIQQLQDEGHVSIFNTVCDLRHQRNFLVQSLKQYIFLYRALVDIAQYGNTEILAKELATTVENLKLRANDSKEQCKLELEFDKIKSIADDTVKKTCAVGNGDENRTKNRNDLVIPFDRNRVILTPMPGREHSTYINASFIEGYDNSESFIITQDPMENTIPDFWRMISEQSIRTIVMMSEIGDGPKKCPRYWADNEIQLDHILVKYIQSESLPYYTRREFNVINCRSNDTIQVIQFQYNGWPTVEGEVPEVTRGMLELVEKAQNHHSSEDHGAMVVHCSLGSDRSSIFVAMCILVQQLRIEKKIDICTTTRKLRSQRNLLIDSYAQYEFLHRAIVNYYDLHRSSLDSPSEC